jgi:hypothetical protein
MFVMIWRPATSSLKAAIGLIFDRANEAVRVLQSLALKGLYWACPWCNLINRVDGWTRPASKQMPLCHRGSIHLR